MRHEYEKNIKCPYCDHEWEDSWEFTDDEGTHECHECGKEFNVSRDIDITYSTSRIDCEENGIKHDYKYESSLVIKRDYKDKLWTDRQKQDWEYIKIMECSICGDKQYPRVTEDEFKQLK